MNLSVGIGIIGTGNIADNGHAPAIKELAGVKLVAVLSRDQIRGREFLAKHHSLDAVVHTSLQSFASDPTIDIAIVCSPDRLHVSHVAACLEAEKNVLVEKPLTTSLEDAQMLVKLADAKNLTLATGFHLRSHVGHRALYARIADGKEIGSLRHIRVIWGFPQADDSNWRAREYLALWWSLAAVGSHCIDLVRWFGSDMKDWKQFFSVISNDVWHGPHDETAMIAGQFSSGVTVEIVSSVQFGPYTRIELFGNKGTAICEDTLGRKGAGDITIN